MGNSASSDRLPCRDYHSSALAGELAERGVLAAALFFSACMLALASPVLAQDGVQAGQRIAPSQWALDGSVGFAVPVGDFSNGLNTGLDVMGAVEYRPAATGRIYFRGEVGYSDFGYTPIPEFQSLGEPSQGSATVLRFAANGLYDFETHSPLQVYALAGLGLYHSSHDELCGSAPSVPFYSCTQSSTGFGLNLGGGVRYPIKPVQLFFELRYQLAFSAPSAFAGRIDAPYFPFQFGVRYLLSR